MGRGILWVLGLAALVGGLMLWLRLPSQGTPQGAVSALPAQARQGAAHDARVFAPEVGSTLPERISAASPAQAELGPPDPSAGSAAPPAGPKMHELGGRVRVFDAAGAPLPEARGTFFLAFSGHARTDTRPVQFERGAWSLTLEVAQDWRRVEVRVPTVEGATARLERPVGELPFPLAGPLDLVLRVRPPALLRVVDAETGRELDEVCVSVPSSLVLRGGTHPGALPNFDCEVPRQASPVAIDRYSWGGADRFLFVGVPGYAWRRLTYDFVAGGTRTVALERGASVTVQGVYPEAEPRTFLRLYATRAPSADEEPGGPSWIARGSIGLGSVGLDSNGMWRTESREGLIHESLLSNGPLEVHGLEPGSYRVALEVGVESTRDAVLAERSVQLFPGDAATVQLVGAPQSERPTALLAGTVRAPDTRKVLDHLPLVFVPAEYRGALEQKTLEVYARFSGEAGPGWREFAWTLAAAPVGRLWLEIPELAFRTSIELPPEGRDDLRIEVPALATLNVRLADDARGPGAPKPYLRWHQGEPAGPGADPPRHAFWIAASSSWRISAPAGPIRLRLIAPGEGYCEERVELVPGEQELALRLRPFSGVRLRLLEGGTPVELPATHDVRLTALGGRGRVIHVDGNAFSRGLFVDEPGTYRLDIPELPSYLPLAPTLVEIANGRVDDHPIELVLEQP